VARAHIQELSHARHTWQLAVRFMVQRQMSHLMNSVLPFHHFEVLLRTSLWKTQIEPAESKSDVIFGSISHFGFNFDQFTATTTNSVRVLVRRW